MFLSNLDPAYSYLPLSLSLLLFLLLLHVLSVSSNNLLVLICIKTILIAYIYSTDKRMLQTLLCSLRTFVEVFEKCAPFLSAEEFCKDSSPLIKLTPILNVVTTFAKMVARTFSQYQLHSQSLSQSLSLSRSLFAYH